MTDSTNSIGKNTMISLGTMMRVIIAVGSVIIFYFSTVQVIESKVETDYVRKDVFGTYTEQLSHIQLDIDDIQKDIKLILKEERT